MDFVSGKILQKPRSKVRSLSHTKTHTKEVGNFTYQLVNLMGRALKQDKEQVQ